MVCRRQLFPAKSYLSSVEHILTFGLGKSDHAEEVKITWPSGKVSSFSNLEAGRLYRVDEQTGVRKP